MCRGDMLSGAEAIALGLIDAVARESQPLDDLLADFIGPILKPIAAGAARIQGGGERCADGFIAQTSSTI